MDKGSRDAWTRVRDAALMVRVTWAELETHVRKIDANLTPEKHDAFYDFIGATETLQEAWVALADEEVQAYARAAQTFGN